MDLVSGVNDVKLCLKQVKDLEAKPKLLGAFKPVCQDSGMFNEMQCHGKQCKNTSPYYHYLFILIIN